MFCPNCNQPTRVLETRLAAPDTCDVARRRKCDACGYAFTTREWVDNSLVVTKHQRVTPRSVSPGTAQPRSTVSGDLYQPWPEGTDNAAQDALSAPIPMDYPEPVPPPLVYPPKSRVVRTGLFDPRAAVVDGWINKEYQDTIRADDKLLEGDGGGATTEKGHIGSLPGQVDGVEVDLPDGGDPVTERPANPEEVSTWSPGWVVDCDK